MSTGSSHANRGIDGTSSYMPNSADLTQGSMGGGTYTGTSRTPTMEDYEAIFGPAARDIKIDAMRNKRHQRWHLPDALRGINPYLTDRIDGLITDTTNSPVRIAHVQ
jgi:hypothetical protein